MQPPHPDQYVLDFTSRANERCSALLGLRAARLPFEITRGRVEGVIELLQRLVLLSKYLPEAMGDSFECDVQVMALAARIERRKSVSEKTVRNWTADAKMLGLLSVDYASQHYGGCRWNTYTVHFDRVLWLIAGNAAEWPEAGGNGRKRPEMISAPGAEMFSDPGAETVSDPNSVFPNVSRKHSPPLRAALSEQPRGTFAPACDEQPVVVSDVFEKLSEPLPWSGEPQRGTFAPASDELEGLQERESLGMSEDRARAAIARAKALGLTRSEPERGTLASAPDESELLRQLQSLDMSEDGARVAITRAKARGLTHAQMCELVERYRVDSASDPNMAVSWLHRWLTGKSRPIAKARASPVQSCSGQRGDALTAKQVSQNTQVFLIVREGRKRGLSDEAIRQECEQRGLVWE